MRTHLILATVLAVIIAFLSAPAIGGDDAPSSAENLVMVDCSVCHTTRRICDNLGTKGAAGWQSTVTRMRGKGAKLSTNEASTVARYLAGLPEGSEPVCK